MIATLFGFLKSLSELLVPKQIIRLFRIRERPLETCKQRSNFNLMS